MKTLWMMIRPGAFWRSLKMTHTPRPARLAVFYLFLAVVIYMVFAGLAGGAAAMDARENRATIVDAMIVGGYAAALPFSDDPPDWYRDRMAGGWPWRTDFTPRGIVGSYLGSALDAFELRYTLLTGSTHGLGKSVLIPLILLGYALLAMLGTPLGFLALPVSRRRAKVRWSHIARITAYSFAPLMVFFLYAVVRFRLVDQGWLGVRRWDLTPVYREVWLLSVWVAPLWLIGWWAEAIRRYLKMPHAWSIAVGIVIIGILIGPLLVLAIWSLLAALVAG
jgi:hypothetical protein